MTTLQFVGKLDLVKSDRQPRQMFFRLNPFPRPLRTCAAVIRLRLCYPLIKIGVRCWFSMRFNGQIIPAG
jgi:hypothetical protein